MGDDEGIDMQKEKDSEGKRLAEVLRPKSTGHRGKTARRGPRFPWDPLCSVTVPASP